MKTTYNELSTDLIRRLALMQHLGKEFFILTDAKENKAFEGTEKEAREQFDADMEDHEGIADFYEWCSDNLTEVEEMDIEDCYNEDYYVLTDEEADEKTSEYVKDSVWAFNASFLSEMTDFDPEIFEAIQSNGKCESNNDVILNTIEKTCGIEDFVSAAISADGRGHFLSSYDGCENEEEVNGETFYIYRIN